MWKTGHSLIKTKMKEEGALLAGEMSGHLFFADRYYGFDDAIYASLRLLEILVADHRHDFGDARRCTAHGLDAGDSPRLPRRDQVRRGRRRSHRTIEPQAFRSSTSTARGFPLEPSVNPLGGSCEHRTRVRFSSCDSKRRVWSASPPYASMSRRWSPMRRPASVETDPSEAASHSNRPGWWAWRHRP